MGEKKIKRFWNEVGHIDSSHFFRTDVDSILSPMPLTPLFPVLVEISKFRVLLEINRQL